MMERCGKVYLVGAGCGKADLITVRGRELLTRCDTVVYDDLIDRELLSFAPAEAARIYMGKRQGCHSASQEEICALLVEEARRGHTVVRLKGGDPFVFGRGGEEILALMESGISCEVVPGISSAIAIPGEAGIPVTHRGVSRSFHVITAHTAHREDGLPEDLEKLAQLSGTLVFLMGLRQLPKLAKGLMEAGMSPHCPAAVVSGGSAPEKAAVRGTLADIAEKAKAVLPPAVIVVGETAAMDLRAPQPLSGIRVGIIGTDAVQKKLRSRLAEQGAEVFSALRMEVKPQPTTFDFTVLDRTASWVVFTSANGVACFFRELKVRKMDLRGLSKCRFAVIGPGTGEALEQHGFHWDLCPEIYTTAALAEALIKTGEKGAPVFLMRSAQGNPLLYERLKEHFGVEEVALYDVEPGVLSEGALLEKADYLVFASAGGVELFGDVYGRIPEKGKCVCIGELTARALCDVPSERILIAEQALTESLVHAILKDQNRL